MSDNHQGNVIQMERDIQEIKVQVELIKKDITLFHRVIDKLDTTNEKLQELINNISSMTNIHQQKILETDKNNAFIWEELDAIKKKINELEKSKWMLIGAFSLVTLVINIFLQLGDR
jgi:chromosome segregation ATPase